MVILICHYWLCTSHYSSLWLYLLRQVDRGCHMISAKAMDNLCKQMGMQADDMTSDMYAHNARVTTAAAITTNVAMPAGVNRGRRK